MKRNIAAITWLLLAISSLGLSSCSQSPAAPPAPPAKENSEALKPNLLRNTWDISYMQGARVGYSSTTVQDIGSGEVILRTENVNHLAIRRGSDALMSTTVSGMPA